MYSESTRPEVEAAHAYQSDRIHLRAPPRRNPSIRPRGPCWHVYRPLRAVVSGIHWIDATPLFFAGPNRTRPMSFAPAPHFATGNANPRGISRPQHMGAGNA